MLRASLLKALPRLMLLVVQAVVLLLFSHRLSGCAHAFPLVPFRSKSACATSWSQRCRARSDLDCFDEAFVLVRGGSGGHGSMAQKFGKARQHVYPTGGSGGGGGDVVFVTDPSLSTLQKFRAATIFSGKNGGEGGAGFRNGARGEDMVVTTPAGTLVFDNSSNALVANLTLSSQRVVVAAGGIGGRGNGCKGRKGERLSATPPTRGQRRCLRLSLQLIAEVGLIGAPNAGKSTLLSVLTNARPKIADYAFTTLVPNLGVCSLSTDPSIASVVLADIPGLIRGAHRGLGLGRGFLRHISHCEVLVHVVDASAPQPWEIYHAINAELALFSHDLARKPQIVVLNKVDRLEESVLHTVRTQMLQAMPHSRLVCCSAEQGRGLAVPDSSANSLEAFKQHLWRFLVKVRTANREQADTASSD